MEHTCRAKMLTPPVPWVRTVSPGFKALDSRPYRPFHAVKAAQGSALACLKSRLEGIGTRACSSNAPYWRNVPSRTPPNPVPSDAALIGPAMWAVLKRVTTLSPGLNRVTREPTDSTVPAPSDPGTTLSFCGKGYFP